MDIEFIRVVPTESQIDELHSFLENRKYSISHKKNPSKNEHTDFVKNHPYLDWYLCYKDDALICSVYVQSDNSIGVNLIEGFEDFFLPIINFIKNSHEPLPPIKSVRRGVFFVNIPSKNLKLIQHLESLNIYEIQRSFSI